MRRVIVLALLHLSLMGVGWTNREVVFAYSRRSPRPGGLPVGTGHRHLRNTVERCHP